MTNFVLHGDDQVASRQKLWELAQAAKSTGREVIYLTDPTVSRRQLLTLSRSQGLFKPEQVLLLESFLSRNPKGVETAEELARQDRVNLIFWESKKLAVAKLAKLAKFFEVLEFKIPAAVFAFLDSLVPQNATASLRFLKKIPAQEIAFLHYRLAQRVRELIWIKEDPQTFALPPQRRWTQAKLEGQARQWSGESLRVLHTKLVELDRQNKRSQLPENLSASLDLLVASL